jgi:hypothetical protein
MPKHTPGPWYAAANQFGYVTATDTDGNPITVCTTRTEADARLIAAAPDMVRALELLLREHDALQMATGYKGDRWAAATYARSILKKAKGEA